MNKLTICASRGGGVSRRYPDHRPDLLEATTAALLAVFGDTRRSLPTPVQLYTVPDDSVLMVDELQTQQNDMPSRHDRNR